LVGLSLLASLVSCTSSRETERPTEVHIQLTRIGEAAKAGFRPEDGYPRGRAPLTPSIPCCQWPHGQCETPPGSWHGDPIWSRLGFDLSQPHRYQYSYEATNEGFTARAFADLDCDGEGITWELTGRVEWEEASPKVSDALSWHQSRNRAHPVGDLELRASGQE